MAKYDLTIAVLTMNRCAQLKNAIESCVAAKLPKKTQFVIVDNASIDETESIVEELKHTINYDIVYSKQTMNLGVGGGRNVCYKLSDGEIVYFLDDDAEISTECRDTFFVKSIENFKKNEKIATLTTGIVDKYSVDRTSSTAKTWQVGGLKCVYTYHGGSVFIKKAVFCSPLYFDIMYGQEEIAVSLEAVDKGFYNVVDDSIWINHMPLVNKWNNNDIAVINLAGAYNIYHIKKLIYPRCFTPILYLAYIARLHRYGVKDKKMIKEYNHTHKEIFKKSITKKLSFKTVLNVYKQFGSRVF